MHLDHLVPGFNVAPRFMYGVENHRQTLKWLCTAFPDEMFFNDVKEVLGDREVCFRILSLRGSIGFPGFLPGSIGFRAAHGRAGFF